MRKPIVWSIAGSDSGSGAGIQADLLTFADFDCHGCTAITANTAQNTLRVAEVNPVPLPVLESQLQALREDLFPAAIKIGLLANGEQVCAVADFLRGLRAIKKIPVVFDPVAVASSGSMLAEESVGDVALRELLPLCDLVTPNRHELEWLVRMPVGSGEQIMQAARKLCEQGCGAALVTGGHSELVAGEVADYLWSGHGGDWLIGERIPTAHTHGTGCTLSSSVAALMARGYPLRDACVVAGAYVRKGLRLGDAADIGAGAGPVGHCGWPDALRDYPRVLLAAEERAGDYQCFDAESHVRFARDFPALDSQRLGLYPVVDSVEWLEKLAQLGVRTLQLRIKNPQGDLHAQIESAVALGRAYDLRLFINDYWQLAIECGAYGVHLGQEDLGNADLRAIKNAGLKLGISTHGFYELLRAYAYGPSYLALGAIFATGTKDMSGQLQGVEKLARMAALLPDYPLVAIGGIGLERAREVVATGVGSIAVVSAVTQARDYQSAVRQFQSLLGE